MKHRFLVMALTTLTLACAYAPYTTGRSSTPVPSAPGIPSAFTSQLQARADDCTNYANVADRAAYDLNRKEYHARTIGALVTLVMGTGAGALGAANSEGLSGASGAASLVSGIATIAWVDKGSLEAAGRERSARSEAYAGVQTAIGDLNAAMIAYYASRGTETGRAAREALARLNTQLTKCDSPTIDQAAFAEAFLQQ